ncbi:MAG: agmatinase [Gemmatimonadota bacterium]|nr:agmatinase [Gemmatimonadota bacterium]
MSPVAVASPRVALLGVCYDGSSSYLRGTAGAPPAIRQALWSEAGNPWTELGIDLSAAALDDEGDLAPAADEDPEQVRRSIEAAVKGIAESGRRPLVLGGDHSITYPILRGFRPFHPRLSILHFDAHGDLWDEFQGDRYSHACPFARIMEEGLTDRLVQVGIRTMTGHQREQGRRFGVEVIEMKDWRDGMKLEFSTPVYVSFDLDVIEPGLAPGISHREAGGFSVRQALALVQSLTAPVVGADFVEFNPAADRTGVTAAVSAKLVKELAARMLVETL